MGLPRHTSTDAPCADDELPEIASRIMDSAIRLFGRKGYSATSVREIVQDARVTNPMLYYYFDSKEGLFHRTIHTLFEYRHQSFVKFAESNAPFAQKLREFVEFHNVTLRESPEIVDFIYAVIFGPRESRPDIDLHGLVARDIEVIAGVFAAGIESNEFQPREGWEPVRLAETFLGVVGNHVMRSVAMLSMGTIDVACREQLTGETAIDDLIDFFLNGAGHSALEG